MIKVFFFVQPWTQCCHSQFWLQWCGPRERAWRCLSTQLSDSHVEVRPSSLGTALFIFMIRLTLKRKDSSSPLWLLAMRQQLIQENTSATMSSATTLRRPSSTFMCQVGTDLSFCPSYCTSWIVAVMLLGEKNCIYNMLVTWQTDIKFLPWKIHTDPQTPFVPSMAPFENHVLTSHDEMEIPCRVTDPSTSVSLIHIETNQVLPNVYDSKRGFVGLFGAGTYVCRALIKGQEHDSIQYIVHGWTGENAFFNCVNGRWYLSVQKSLLISAFVLFYSLKKSKYSKYH